MECDKDIRLEVMVAVYGRCAMERMAAAHRLQPAPGVRYLLAWQLPEGEYPGEVPAVLAGRRDVTVEMWQGRGVSANRNRLLDMATAPYLLCADDDIDYTAEGLNRVIEGLDSDPDADIMTFRIRTTERRPYPPDGATLGYSRHRRNFYPYLVEVAMRREAVRRAGLRFDERFGTNAPVLGAGEEDVFLYDAWRAGLTLRHRAAEILTHDAPSTVSRRATDPAVVMARGAVLRHIYGRSAWLRQLRLALSLPGNPLRNWRLLRQPSGAGALTAGQTHRSAGA